MKNKSGLIRYAAALLVIGITGFYAVQWYMFRQEMVEISSESYARRGVNYQIIEQQQRFLSSRDTFAYLILRDGQLIYEWYGDDDDAITTSGIASLTKALVGGMVLFKAVNDGYLNFDDFAYEALPAWKKDSQKSKIKIFHLASHSSGMEDACTLAEEATCAAWKKDYWPNRHTAKGFEIANNLATLKYEPGKVFLYSNPAYNNVLSYLITKSLNKTPLSNIPDYLYETISKPLGISAKNIVINQGELVDFDNLKLAPIGGGSRFTARAAIRFGQLILNNGRWNGVSIISQKTFDTALRAVNLPKYQGSDIEQYPRPAIGGWWLNTDKVWRKIPADTIVGAGANHQIIVIVPSKKLVAVRFGGKLGNDGWDGDFWVSLEKYLLNPLLNAVPD
ncbi:MAG: serine hydrolase domain-containing protein [Thiohalomonadales bacterium]